MNGKKFVTNFASRPVQIKDGFTDVPTGPGLGIEVDEDVVKRYEVK